MAMKMRHSRREKAEGPKKIVLQPKCPRGESFQPGIIFCSRAAIRLTFFEEWEEFRDRRNRTFSRKTEANDDTRFSRSSLHEMKATFFPASVCDEHAAASVVGRPIE